MKQEKFEKVVKLDKELEGVFIAFMAIALFSLLNILWNFIPDKFWRLFCNISLTLTLFFTGLMIYYATRKVYWRKIK